MPFTAKEIEELKEDHRSLAGWIKELCWQVAKLNEKPVAYDQTFRIDDTVELTPVEPRQKRKYVRKAKIA